MMSKLMQPRTRDTLVRHRLNHLVRRLPEKKLTLVTAGPGYGKTTLASHAVGRTQSRVIWYRLDPYDDDPAVFFAYLIAGIQQHHPEFAIQRDGDGAAFTEDFLPFLEKSVDRDVVLVLDDFHLIRPHPEIRAFLQTLLDRHAPFFHLVLIGRSVPDLKLSRLMASQDLVWIREPDLLFDEGETLAFFNTCFNLTLSDADTACLVGKTRGWVSGLILFYQALQTAGKGDAADLVKSFKGSQRYVFNYMEENVFQLLDDPVQAFLLETSILSELHAGFCNRFLERKDAERILNRLADGHFFTSALDEGRHVFAFHPLFHDFLKEKLAMAYPPDRVAKLYNRAAQLYEKEDEGQQALQHHLLAGNMGDASRLLNHLGRTIIKQGRPQMVKSLLSSIPKHYMDDEPWFQYLQTGYLRLCNRLEMAVQTYERMLQGFRRHKDEQGECICRMELAEYYFSTGNLKQSESEYKKILHKKKLDPYLTIIVMGYLIRVLALLRRPDEADKFARQAKALLPVLGDALTLKMAKAWISMARGYRFLLSGNYHKAMELGETAKSLFHSLSRHQLMFSGYFLISCACFYLGRFEKGVEAAREGIRLQTEKGVFDEFSEFLYLFHARNRLEMAQAREADISEALAACRKGLKKFEANDFPGGMAQACLVLGRARLAAGQVAQAENVLRKGLAIPAIHDMPLIVNELKVALSQLLFFSRGKDRDQEAMVLLKEAEQALIYSGWHMCWISRIFARYYWEAGHRETCFKYIVYCLKISEEEGFDNWLVPEQDWIIPLFAELLAMEAMTGYVRGLLLKMGTPARTQLTALERHARPALRKAVARALAQLPEEPPPGIHAGLLGSFRLSVGDTPIPEKRWKSKKARTLFKYLLCHRRKGFVDKEILMELLWPDNDPKKSAQRFHVALASLRKTLEPDIAKGRKSAYIKRSGSSYRIDTGRGGQVDLEAFLEAVDLAEKAASDREAVSFYKTAVSLYRGDLLAEDPFEEWCLYERERFQTLYLQVLKKIIEFHEKRQEFSECIRFATRYLRKDPYAETIIRSLMTYYDRIGNKPMVRRIYEGFKSTIKKEFNCGLSDETEILYAELG